MPNLRTLFKTYLSLVKAAPKPSLLDIHLFLAYLTAMWNPERDMPTESAEEVVSQLRLKVTSCMAFVILALLAHTSRALAGMAVTPSKIELAMTQGGMQKSEIHIVNDSRIKLRIALSTWDFARDRNSCPFPIRPEEAKVFRGCGSWVAFDSKTLTLDPDQTKTVQINVQVPSSLSQGSYYTYIQVLGIPLNGNGDVLVKSKINALLLVTVGFPSDVTYLERAMRVRDLQIKSINVSGPVALTPVVENSGNYHLNMKGAIKITQGKRIIKEIPIKESTLLPKDKLQIKKVWEDPPPLGKFTAQFDGKAPGLDKVLTARKTFWVVSKQLIIGAGLAAAVMAGALLLGARYWLGGKGKTQHL